MNTIHFAVLMYTKCKQCSTTNEKGACESRDSQNTTGSYLMQVSGKPTTKSWYQNTWHTSKVSRTRLWYQFLGGV